MRRAHIVFFSAASSHHVTAGVHGSGSSPRDVQLPPTLWEGKGIPLALGHLDVAEDVTARLTTWLQTAGQESAVELLHTSTVDHVGPHHWSDAPDVLEGDHGELTAPHHGQGDAADQGHDFVAAVFAAVEAGVGVLPHTVHGMGALWLSEDIFESDLDMVVEFVRVPVGHIKVGHGDVCSEMTLTAKEELNPTSS